MLTTKNGKQKKFFKTKKGALSIKNGYKIKIHLKKKEAKGDL